MKRLISELRDASHAATGQLAVKVKACDLGAAVREAAQSLAAAAKAKGHALEISAPALKGAADKARVRQIAWILLSNAVKYSPKGASIALRLERLDDEAVLTVSDEGPGIPVSLRSQIFDLTRMPAADLPPRGRGLGLGLSIARRLVELHGGSIKFNDESGRGTVFTVRLPLASKRKP
jgi:signal transduction histidine kinase